MEGVPQSWLPKVKCTHALGIGKFDTATHSPTVKGARIPGTSQVGTPSSPPALAQIAPFFPPGTAMWTSGLQGRRGQPGLAVTLAPKQRWGPGWSSASRRTPGPVPSTPEPLLEDQWPHVGMEASIDQVDCPGGGVGPQMGEGLWRAGPWRDLGSLETPRCVWLWVSASLSIKPGNWAQWPEAPLPG